MAWDSHCLAAIYCSMAPISSLTLPKVPRRMRFSQVPEEPFHHVQPGTAGRGEVHVEPGMPLEPCLHLGMLVGGVVVRDQVQFLVGRRTSSMTLRNLSHSWWRCGVTRVDHLPIQCIEGGKERGRAVAFVVVGHRPAAPFLIGNRAGCGPVPGSGSSHRHTARWRAPAG